MRAHTRTRHTKTITRGRALDESASISGDEFYKELFGEFPKWATYLSGFRLRNELTQAQLAKEIGVSQPNISQMESGKRPIGKAIAKRLADIFKTDYRLFL
jgi:DNA-binding XRE family transcriptional regulator